MDLDGDGKQEILAMNAAGATITGVDYGELRAYTYNPGAPGSITQRWRSRLDRRFWRSIWLP